MRSWAVLGCVVHMVVLAGMINSAVGAPGEVKVYSNVCYNVEGDDVLGTEIVLVDMGGREMYVIYGEAVGSGPSTDVVDLAGPDFEKLRQGQLEFEGATPFSGKEVFRGRITNKEIVLTAGGVTRTGLGNEPPESPIHLKRVKLPVHFPAC